MQQTRSTTLAAALVVALLAAASAFAQTTMPSQAQPPATSGSPVAERRLSADLFIAGSSITVNQPVAGDLIGFGGSVDVDAPVTGDMIGAGGRLRVGVDVGGSIYAAGGQLTVHGKVGRSLRAAGGQFELGPKSEVAGNLSVAAGQVRLHGSVRGSVQAAGGRVLIDGPVGGDVLATSGHVELGPNARIAGKLRYRSGEPLQQDPAARVAGGVELLMPAIGDGQRRAQRAEDHRARALAGGVGWVWTAGMIVLAAALIALLPGFYARVAVSLRERPGTAIALGFVLLICTPVAALIALVTLIGIPLALLLIALYLALLPVGYVSAGIGLGDWGLRRASPARADSVGWRIAATALALVLLALLGWVPWLGWLIGLAALLAGLGALLLQLRRLLPGEA